VGEIGIFLSSEEQSPNDLVAIAKLAEEYGYRSVLISDHYHPWTSRQGESPFVWSVIGAIAATTDLGVTTAVTCPTFRIHPAVIAQACATSAALTAGRFRFGVGSGEALNEHILGDAWPPAAIRLEMLEEAIGLIRELWTGHSVTHRGRYFQVDDARIYSLPDAPPPILMSGFGETSTSLAARVADGYINTAPASELVGQYRREGGTGPAVAVVKVCYGSDEAAARKLAFDIWPTTGVPGELSQVLPTPAHFEQAVQRVTEDDVTSTIVCGPDPDRHAEMIKKYLDAGFDEVHISQIGPEQREFFEFYRREVLPRVGDIG
jgi:G6PDH family F420-dependent oxidoreductase